MLIRDYYEQAFNAIKSEHGEQPSSHVIPANISLEQAIGYTRRHVIEGVYNKRHYRYDRYRNALDKALKEKLRFRPVNRRIVNLDLGCGPGLFSWVVRDYMLKEYGSNDGDISLIGYDHAKNMIRLADLFRERLSMKINFAGYFETEKIRETLGRKDFPGDDVIITLGHVLIQASSDGIRNFAEIIQNLYQSHFCILIAVDALRIGGWGELRPSCERLRADLGNCGVNIECVLDDSRNCIWACI